MRAMIVQEPGGNGRLEPVHVPDPEPGFGEVVVRVVATGVNSADLLVNKGFFGPEPRIPGHDVAGVVVALGGGVTGLPLNTRVLLNPAVTCGVCLHCAQGNHGTCRRRRALGQLLDGGYAEFVKIPAENVHPIADAISFEHAAAVPSNYFTAWQMLFSRAALKPGETVLVTAAAGGVGSAALQIAKLAGARVIAAVGREDKRRVVHEWGADETINYATDNLGEQVLALTGGSGADVVLDIVGASFWPHYMKAVRAGGRIVVCSLTGGRKPDLDMVDLLSKQISIFGTGGNGSKIIAARVVDLLNQGRLAGRIDRVLPLSQAAAAQDAISSRTVIGKIILKP